MDIDLAQAVLGIIGPLGVLVLAVIWMLLNRRSSNGVNHTRAKVVETLTKIDADVSHLKTDASEIKADVREVRSAVTQHLQNHT